MLAKTRGIHSVVEIWEPALWVIFVWGVITFISYNFMRDSDPVGIPYVTLTGNDPASLLDSILIEASSSRWFQPTTTAASWARTC